MDISRTQLYHSIRNTRPNKDVSMITGSDIRIDVLQ